MALGTHPITFNLSLWISALVDCISLQSINGDKALSAYITEFSSFNVIDADRLDEIKKDIEMSGISNESNTGLEPQPIPLNIILP